MWPGILVNFSFPRIIEPKLIPEAFFKNQEVGGGFTTYV